MVRFSVHAQMKRIKLISEILRVDFLLNEIYIFPKLLNKSPSLAVINLRFLYKSLFDVKWIIKLGFV